MQEESAASVPLPGSRIGLSLTASYAPSWGVWEGLRELVQNWHDGLLASDAACPELAAAPLEFLPSAAEDGQPRGRLRFEARRGGRAVGSCEYVAEERCLLLVNHNVGLGRQVLLLGYSKKAQHQDVIGSFGEGLKVGAVALLRRGLGLRMLTREEQWGFELAVDPAFGEKVLTVQVAARAQQEAEKARLPEEEQAYVLQALQELRTEDTATLLEGLREEEWTQLSQRFLFLAPPAEAVRTEVGRLLLDPHHAGSFYVRGVWINDDPDLSAGVDLFDIRLDRDRAAVLRKSDLEHQVSSMWVRAVKFNPALKERYYELLAAGAKSSDIAHADLYCDEDVCEALAAEFKQRFGDGVPISMKDANSSKVATLRAAFNESTVVVSNALLAVLKKAGVRCDLDELLREGEAKGRQHVPMAALSDEEACSLAKATRLAERAFAMADDGLSPAPAANDTSSRPGGLISKVDVFDCTTSWGLDSIAKVAEPFSVTGRFEVDRRALSSSAVHGLLPHGQCIGDIGEGSGAPCWCAPAVLACSLHAAHGSAGGSATKLFGIERLIAGLAGRAFPAGSSSSPPLFRCPDLGTEREAGFRSQIEALEQLLQNERSSHVDELCSLQRRVGDAERELSRTEVKIMDAQAAERALRDEWGPEMARLREELTASQQARFLSEEQKAAGEAAVRELNVVRRCFETLEQQLAVSEEARRRGLEAADARESRLRQSLARRRELIQKMVHDDPASPLIALVDGAELQAAVEEIRAALREEAQQRQCCVCADGPADALLLPCRHQQLCQTCAQALMTCPVCRTRIETRMQVYTS